MAIKINVGVASCGLAAGAGDIYEALDALIKEKSYDVVLNKTGCIGMCFAEPVVEFELGDNKSITYGYLTAKDMPEIVEGIISGNPVLDKAILSTDHKCPENDNLASQERIVLRNCGVIDPENIDDYIANKGYKSIEKVLKSMTQIEVIDEIKKSGLRGRGGAGFSTGLKWQFAYDAKNDKKYVICNADEGDPGAFMDRSVLEGDPHSILEGMAICAYAIGADEGYIYCRAEYPLAVKHYRLY
jgi:NADH-quinone oxidoreductase subunit F